MILFQIILIFSLSGIAQPFQDKNAPSPIGNGPISKETVKSLNEAYEHYRRPRIKEQVRKPLSIQSIMQGFRSRLTTECPDQALQAEVMQFSDNQDSLVHYKVSVINSKQRLLVSEGDSSVDLKFKQIVFVDQLNATRRQEIWPIFTPFAQENVDVNHRPLFFSSHEMYLVSFIHFRGVGGTLIKTSPGTRLTIKTDLRKLDVLGNIEIKLVDIFKCEPSPEISNVETVFCWGHFRRNTGILVSGVIKIQDGILDRSYGAESGVLPIEGSGWVKDFDNQSMEVQRDGRILLRVNKTIWIITKDKKVFQPPELPRFGDLMMTSDPNILLLIRGFVGIVKAEFHDLKSPQSFYMKFFTPNKPLIPNTAKRRIMEPLIGHPIFFLVNNSGQVDDVTQIFSVIEKNGIRDNVVRSILEMSGSIIREENIFFDHKENILTLMLSIPIQMRLNLKMCGY